jgi:hypothetical protein
MFRIGRLLPVLLLLLAPGCITRIVTVKTNPTGALVYLNDEEIGRTPVSREFQWYGIYDVLIRKDGYQTLKTQGHVSAPLWQWIPLDLLTDLLPVTDEHVITFDLKPQLPADPATVLSNGEQMQTMLESSERTKTRLPATHATTQTTKPAKVREATPPLSSGESRGEGQK